MGKATIIEAQNSQTVYEEGKNGILGKLKGIFADYINGTRNADRLYSEELWDNSVFGSEEVMEALETRTLFGELDHPEGDRCETLAKNAAISITKLEKRPDEGVIYGEADILDTPTGRIVKALADSGAKLGVSSRGMGEEMYENGRNIINPYTYAFITFDVVVTPANTKARVSLTESKHINLLTESLKKEVNECETVNQLQQVKKVLESVSINEKDSLVETINKKLESINSNNANVNKLTEANKSIALKLIQEKYFNCKKQLDESIMANEQLSEENKKLIENKEFLSDSRQQLKTMVKESINNKNINNEEKEKLNEQIEELREEVDELTKQLSEERSSHEDILLNKNKIEQRKLETLEENYKEKISQLEESLNKSEDKFNNLIVENKKLVENLYNERKILVENKKENQILSEKIKQLESKQIEQTTKLTESKKLEESKCKILENKLKASESKCSELEKENKELNESLLRFKDLAFNPIGTATLVKENNLDMYNYTDEEKALFNVLVNG